MAYPERIRQHWIKAVNGKCQQEVYSEEHGFQNCNEPVEHVHHILPEGWTLAREGHEADTNVALPLCKNHHVGTGGEEHSQDFSYHPEIGEAQRLYGPWKEESEKLKRRGLKPYPSPYVDAVKRHREQTKRGKRYWAGTEELDRYYEEKMTAKVIVYQAETGEKKPICNRRSIRYKKKKHWSEGLFD